MVTALQNHMADYIAAFAQDGVLILPGFFNDAELNTVQVAIDAVKRNRPMDVVIDDLENGDRTVLGLMTQEAVRTHRMKVNDLYLCTAEIRGQALAAGLVPVLWGLLGHVPVLCNSLYLEKGSAQDAHVDALYMTPRTPGHLIAVWVALEDAHEAAGPLEYFPGSHRIAPYVFSSGSHHTQDEEMQEWRAYMDEALARAGLEKRQFLARKGDVLIWHAHLLHAGGAIQDAGRTRKSCVFHYYSEIDARASGFPLIQQAGGFWLDRPLQSLPPDVAAQLPVSERHYLRRYPDVAAAVAQGLYPSGAAHYAAYGRKEGRLPV